MRPSRGVCVIRAQGTHEAAGSAHIVLGARHEDVEALPRVAKARDTSGKPPSPMSKRKVTARELRQGIELHTGERHNLILAFARNKSLLVEGSVFAFDSAFPSAGILLHLEQVQRALGEETDARIAVFGHTDVKGSEAHNKRLSERRAKAALAMLKRDVDLFDSVAEDDTWGTRQYQVMLRALGCNPGAIDGVEGEMTKSAVRGFQRGYNENVYHRDPDSPSRAHEDLVVDGLLGPKTKAALRDAYVVSSSCRVDDSRLSDPPSVGCSELNPISDRDEENRRVMIALIGPEGPRRSDYPCVEGDVGACPRAGDDKTRCLFYRRYFKEYEELDTAPFFDFRWLREMSGAVHLSALTPLPDGPAQFTIYRYDSPIVSPMPSSQGGEPRPSLLGEELDVVRGEIRGGVAYVRWTPPDDFDPFDFGDWLVDHDHDLELFDGDEPEGGPVDSAALLEAKGMRPPVFLVEAGEHWGFSMPPSEDLDDVRITQDSTGRGVAIGYDAGLVPWQATDGRTSPTKPLPPDVRILALFMEDREVTPGEDTPEVHT